MEKIKLKRAFSKARIVCLLALCAALFLSGFGGVIASAETKSVSARAVESVSPSLTAVGSRNVQSYPSYPLSVFGRSTGSSVLLVNGEIYIPTKALAQAVGITASYNSSLRTLVVSGKGLYLTVSDGAFVTYANDRPLFTGHNSALMSDGQVYTPAKTLMKAFGLKYTRTSGGAVAVSGTFTPLTHASKFYREDEVLWLSRIISAESRGEPLIGQIAVGSVVMNRVASREYPNTIYSVIFDRKYGVQFSPILDGSIYNTPTYNCTLAAKICLEGVRVGEGALFFLRPEASSSLWIPTTRRFLYSIGNHDFYA